MIKNLKKAAEVSKQRKMNGKRGLPKAVVRFLRREFVSEEERSEYRAIKTLWRDYNRIKESEFLEKAGSRWVPCSFLTFPKSCYEKDAWDALNRKREESDRGWRRPKKRPFKFESDEYLKVLKRFT